MKPENQSSNSFPSDGSLDLHKVSRKQDKDLLHSAHQIRSNDTRFLAGQEGRTPLKLAELQKDSTEQLSENPVKPANLGPGAVLLPAASGSPVQGSSHSTPTNTRNTTVSGT